MAKSNVKIIKLSKTGPLFRRPVTKRIRSGYVILKPGQSIGEHSTGQREEILIILTGTARLTANGKSSIVRAGRSAYNPPKTIHNVTNIGRTTLRYVYIVA